MSFLSYFLTLTPSVNGFAELPATLETEMQTGELKKTLFHAFLKILALYSKCHTSIHYPINTIKSVGVYFFPICKFATAIIAKLTFFNISESMHDNDIKLSLHIHFFHGQ